MTIGVPHEPVSIDILACIKKRLRIQGTQSGSPLELCEMMEVVRDHSIVPDIELSGIDAAPGLMDDLASGKLVSKVGISFEDTF